MTKQEKVNNLFKDIVLRFAQESHCESKKVAALAVKNGRIIATGINGTPTGFINCDEHFKVLHTSENIQLPYNEWIKTPEWRTIHHEWSTQYEIHAEQSLICEAARNSTDLSDTDIYISLEPCVHCAKLLAALKPNRIFYVNKYDKSMLSSAVMLSELGFLLEQI